MKKMCIFIENQNEIENLYFALETLSKEGTSIFFSDEEIRRELKHEMTRFDKEKAEADKLPNAISKALKECLCGVNAVGEMLVLTDILPFASLLAAADVPVLAYVHEDNRGQELPGVKYVIEGFEDVDGAYFRRIWQRLEGKPWLITQTSEFVIRETTESDVDAFYEIYSEPSITRYMEPLFEDKEEELVYTKDYREKVYEFYGFGMWTVLEKETNRVIGRAGISMREGYDDPELGFVIAKPFQGKGIATRVCKAVLEFAYREFEFNRFNALVHRDNTASVRLLLKLGFRRECAVVEGGEELELYVCEC